MDRASDAADAAWEFADPRGGDHLAVMNRIDASGFGHGIQWSAESLGALLAHTDVLAFLRAADGLRVGYYLVQIPDEPLEGGRVAWANASCICREAQGQGMAGRFWAALGGRYPDLGWRAGRTQHPAVARSFRRTTAAPVYPFDRPYPPEVAAYLMEEIYELRVAGERGAVPPDGILRGFYPEGKLGEYVLRDEVSEDERWLAERGFAREQGDAVVLLGRWRDA